MRKLISLFKQSRLIQQIKDVLKNSNVSKFIDIRSKNVQEDVPVIETEQISALNLTQATNEGTTTQLNASVVN